MNLAVKCPILGFEETKTMEFKPVDELFAELKSLDGSDFKFVLVNAQVIRPGYDFEIPTYYQELLGLNADSKREAYIIMAMHKDLSESSLNFLAPIVINWDNNSLVQVILDSATYPEYFQADKISNYVKKD
ncbi:flagellar biosynthesis protein FliW [Campylobacter sp. MIT 12-8780]|uniref:flagellar assembly protein FliW n=1 Tax=unclassified Campylobacter TaxID=2593542 RepID=UPI0010F9A502|nr:MULTISPECIES: flagellar assembly protein FliW [unclassified Campylobacter]NDJ26853.1 flagellar assembly protein FliW [Campylobacter sp. MIT 19-121]TKX28596.1 flagellar biosynthesis protein FliW [Campylobacter sp. MIT 12-5580]TQR42001.1 flagellar biosynthesis protein FliW [Campylobacter sp. MIT 12-8780]